MRLALLHTSPVIVPGLAKLAGEILPEVEVGRSVKMRNVIIDRGCKIPPGMTIGYDHDQDRENGFRVSKQGVVLVTRGMLGQPEGYA